jgi:hypothetical protein
MVGGVAGLPVSKRKASAKSMPSTKAEGKPADEARREAAVDREVARLADKVHANA